MVRNYVAGTSRKLTSYKRKEIQKALDDMKKYNISYREAGKRHGISFSVLFRYNTRPYVRNIGGQTVLTSEEENLIVENINTCAEWGYPMKRYDLQIVVKRFLDKKGAQCKKFKNNMPGIDFAVGFLRRHKNEIPQTYIQSILRRDRAPKLCQSVKKCFDHLELTLDYVPETNIINYIEINLSNDLMLSVMKRISKYPDPDSVSNDSISLVIAGTADGILLPPYVIYKAQNIPDSWKSGIGNLFTNSASGCMDIITFEDWINKVVIPYSYKIEGTTYLIADYLSCHLSSDCIENCKNNDVRLSFIPPILLHLMQPLHVAFYKSIKIAWREILKVQKKIEKRNSIPLAVYPQLLSKLFDIINKNAKANLLSGFKKTGISPLERGEVLNIIPAMKKNSLTKTTTRQIKHPRKNHIVETNDTPLKIECFMEEDYDEYLSENGPVKTEVISFENDYLNGGNEEEMITKVKEESSVNVQSDFDLKTELAVLKCWICHSSGEENEPWTRCSYCQNNICINCSGNDVSPHEFICTGCFQDNILNSIANDTESLYIFLTS